MTEESTKGKLTLSGKTTLTLKKTSKSPLAEGKKVVQVEVRKKRNITLTKTTVKAEEIDEATAQKLKLLAEAKLHDAKRKQEEDAKEALRIKQQEEEKAAEIERQKEEAAKEKAEIAEKQNLESVKKSEEINKTINNSDTSTEYKSKKNKDYDDDDDDEEYYKKSKKSSSTVEKRSMTKEETFEQERKKIQKRSFEPQRRNNKINVNNYMGSSDDDDDYGYMPQRRFKKKQPKPVQTQVPPAEKIVHEVIIPETITVQELANRMAEKSADVIKRLMSMGVMATINQAIDADTAQIIVEDMGHKYKRVADSDVEEGLGGAEDAAEDCRGHRL